MANSLRLTYGLVAFLAGPDSVGAWTLAQLTELRDPVAHRIPPSVNPASV